MTDLTKIDTANALPVVMRPIPVRRRVGSGLRRSKSDQAFYEMIEGLAADKTYHAAATYAAYAIGVIGAATFFGILSAVIG